MTGVRKSGSKPGILLSIFHGSRFLPGSQVTVEFENEDGAPHNVAFYTTPSLTTTIYKGAIIDGPGKITYVFAAPAIPGTYFFRCDLHPSMQGQFIVT